MKKSILLLATLLMFSFATFAQNAIEPPLITVNGQAEVRVPPDEVVFTLGVETIDKDILAARTRTDDRVKEVLAIAKRNGIKAEDVQTSYISIQPKYNTDDLEYEQRRAVKREFLGDQVSKTIAVILREISRFDSLLSDVLKAGVTRLSNVEFRDSQLRRHRDQARTMAMKAAQEKPLLAAQIGPTQRSLLLNHDDRDIRARADALFGHDAPGPRQEILAQYRPALARQGSGISGIEPNGEPPRSAT